MAESLTETEMDERLGLISLFDLRTKFDGRYSRLK
jgi:hypothetical protein